MKRSNLAIGITVAALGLLAADVMAARVATSAPNRSGPRDVIESPFDGVVVNVSPVGLSVKGEVKSPRRPANNPDPNGDKANKPSHQTVHFSIKGAKITRDGKPCEVKDIQKGDTVSVTFKTKEGSEKHIVSEIAVSKGDGDAGEKKAAGKK